MHSGVSVRIPNQRSPSSDSVTPPMGTPSLPSRISRLVDLDLLSRNLETRNLPRLGDSPSSGTYQKSPDRQNAGLKSLSSEKQRDLEFSIDPICQRCRCLGSVVGHNKNEGNEEAGTANYLTTTGEILEPRASFGGRCFCLGPQPPKWTRSPRESVDPP